MTEEKKQPAALVIGAGIAGIQAALDIGNAGFQVYLVEREPSVGGHMSQLDKTFPTLDCSACILTPKMVDVAAHPNIELMTYSEVLGVEGEVGSFSGPGPEEGPLCGPPHLHRLRRLRQGLPGDPAQRV
jgi:heterodisulfide reductase subunit A-like polyferredoxin